MEEFRALMRRRVAAGMDWLDAHYPDHAERVDLDDFDISSPWRCALAQAAQGHYLDAALSCSSLTSTVSENGKLMPYARALGFDIGRLESSEIEILNRTWIEAYRHYRREPSES